MSAPRFRFVPPVEGLAALGARGFEDFLGDCAGLETGDRARVLARAGACTRLLVPLPGTPGERGVPRERPRGAGTGWLRLHVYEGARTSFAEACLARFRAPRSASLAARDWNLACHLRAHGVSTPDLLALGERMRGPLRSDSFLVLRELEGFFPLPLWLGAERSPRERRLAVRAIGAALAATFRCGAWLPDLRAHDVWLSSEPGPAPCAAEASAAPDEAHAGRAGLRRMRLPSVAIVRFEGGRILRRVGPSRRRELLGRLAADLRRDLGPRAPARREELAVLALSARA